MVNHPPFYHRVIWSGIKNNMVRCCVTLIRYEHAEIAQTPGYGFGINGCKWFKHAPTNDQGIPRVTKGIWRFVTHTDHTDLSDFMASPGRQEQSWFPWSDILSHPKIPVTGSGCFIHLRAGPTNKHWWRHNSPHSRKAATFGAEWVEYSWIMLNGLVVPTNPFCGRIHWKFQGPTRALDRHNSPIIHMGVGQTPQVPRYPTIG